MSQIHPPSVAREIEFLDLTLQGLYALGLKLEYCLALVDESPEQARFGLDAALSGMSALMEPIRDEIERLTRTDEAGANR